MQLHFEIPDGAEIAPAVAEACLEMAKQVLTTVREIDGLTVTAVLVPVGAYSGLVALGDVPVVRAPVPDGWQLAVVPCEDEQDPVDPFARIDELEAELEVVSLAMVTVRAALDREKTRAAEDVAAVNRSLVTSQQQLTQAKQDLAAARAAQAKQAEGGAEVAASVLSGLKDRLAVAEAEAAGRIRELTGQLEIATAAQASTARDAHAGRARGGAGRSAAAGTGAAAGEAAR